MQIFLVPLLKKNYLLFKEFYKLRTVGRKKGKLEIQLKYKRDQSSLSGSCSYFSFQYIDLQVQEPFFIFAEEKIFFLFELIWEKDLGFQAQKVTFHGSPGLLENKLARLQYRQKEVQNSKQTFVRILKEARGTYLLSLNYWYS